MNASDVPHAAELCLLRTLTKAEEYVRREPARALTAAIGAGILLKVLPARSVARPVATITALLLPSVLLGLGLVKVFELCCEAATSHRAASPSANPPATT